VTGLEIPAGDE